MLSFFDPDSRRRRRHSRQLSHDFESLKRDTQPLFDVDRGVFFRIWDEHLREDADRVAHIAAQRASGREPQRPRRQSAAHRLRPRSASLHSHGHRPNLRLHLPHS